MGQTVRNHALRWRLKGPRRFLSRDSTDAQKKEKTCNALTILIAKTGVPRD